MNYNQSDIQANKNYAAIANIPILFFIPLIICPSSAFAKFHANQGLLLLILGLAVSIVTTVIGWILTPLAVLISLVCGLAIFVLMIIGILNALAGKATEFPYIGQYKILK